MAAMICGPLPRYLRHWRDQQDLDICKKNLAQLANALEDYSTFEGLQSPKSLNDLTPKYLNSLPRCPATPADIYAQDYEFLNKPGDWTPWSFTICCRGQHQVRTGDSPQEHRQAEILWR